jgi:hypothetical protein
MGEEFSGVYFCFCYGNRWNGVFRAAGCWLLRLYLRRRADRGQGWRWRRCRSRCRALWRERPTRHCCELGRRGGGGGCRCHWLTIASLGDWLGRPKTRVPGRNSQRHDEGDAGQSPH